MSATPQFANAPAEVPSYTSSERRLVIIAAAAGWGLEFFDLMLVSLMTDRIGASFGIASTALGGVLTAQIVATAAGGLLFGWLADLYGRRRVLSWTIWMFSICSALSALAPTLEWFYVARVLTGLGVGGEWAVGFALLNEAWKPTRRGLAGGLVQAAIWPAFGVAIFVTSAVDDWRTAFVIGLAPAAVAVWIRIKCPESKQWLAVKARRDAARDAGRNQTREASSRDAAPPAAQDASSPWRELLKSPTLRLVALGTATVFGAQYSYYVYSSWMPTYLRESLALGQGASDAILYGSAAVSFVAYVAAGYLSDIVGRRRALLGFASVQLVAFFAFAVLNAADATVTPIVVSYFFMSIGLGYFGIFGAWFGELFPTVVRATASSFAYSVGRGIAGFGPWLVGLLAASYGLGGGISTGVVAVAATMLMALLLTERQGRTITATE